MNSENIKVGQVVSVEFTGRVDQVRDGYVQVRSGPGMWVLAPMEALREVDEPKEVGREVSR